MKIKLFFYHDSITNGRACFTAVVSALIRGALRWRSVQILAISALDNISLGDCLEVVIIACRFNDPLVHGNSSFTFERRAIRTYSLSHTVFQRFKHD
jgi:hypothetical protein